MKSDWQAERTKVAERRLLKDCSGFIDLLL